MQAALTLNFHIKVGATKYHLAGRNWPAGREFETPGVDAVHWWKTTVVTKVLSIQTAEIQPERMAPWPCLHASFCKHFEDNHVFRPWTAWTAAQSFLYSPRPTLFTLQLRIREEVGATNRLLQPQVNPSGGGGAWDWDFVQGWATISRGLKGGENPLRYNLGS